MTTIANRNGGAVHQPATDRRPQATPRPAVRPRVPTPSPVRVAYQPPARWHGLLPAGVRNAMESLGWWQNPVPLKPSQHLMQVIDVIEQYGWCQSLDFSPTGRMCIRGAQKFLLHGGYVTEDACRQGVAYMQQTLQEKGFHQPFFHWNDLEERTFPEVKAMITAAAHAAHINGE